MKFESEDRPGQSWLSRLLLRLRSLFGAPRATTCSSQALAASQIDDAHHSPPIDTSRHHQNIGVGDQVGGAEGIHFSPADAIRHQQPTIRHPLGRHCTAKEQATELFDWLQMKGLVNGCVLASELRDLHIQMCLEMNLIHRSWNSVAEAYRKLTSGKKTYVWEEGRMTRRRVHELPPALP